MWIECVPNFSEGRRLDVMQAIAEAAASAGARVLGMEGDYDHNRSVLTLAGETATVEEAVLRAAFVAVSQIDLRRHVGTHPRMGAIDVIPFIPLEGTNMADAVQAAQRVGERLGRELGLPVYLYEHAATIPQRRNLADVRRGEFEGLAARMSSDVPDYGPSSPHPSAGAVAVGARRPLIAFNVFLNTTDIQVAQAVAKAVRNSSGGLAGVKALAMDTVSQGQVQVSLNLVDYPKTSLPRAVEMVRQEAQQYGVSVARTELVGLMPVQALLDTARYYLQQPDLTLERILEWQLMEQIDDAGRVDKP
ncbi:glutamate formimidoyltransferase [Sulfobacillus sp. hq2]|uniref:glutamate formimidoyltransferase n=1 Tax=Sulfobacillus TaxID=28033 RepID=UPI000CD1E2A4|nr:glutamate formimidoyltransferase [Sulfobacillus sp. hq2]POB11916.1 glutamate formimidoyltransferase [Sulfobacillus sp. hq2]